MSYLVFSQAPELQPDEFRLVQQARSYFGAELELPERRFRGEGASARAELVLGLQPKGRQDKVWIRALVRPVTPEDHARADEAERRGRAGGMALLARRCRFVWEVSSDAASESDLLAFCALLASTLLGPVMPADGSTLFGVRGARERAERAERDATA